MVCKKKSSKDDTLKDISKILKNASKQIKKDFIIFKKKHKDDKIVKKAKKELRKGLRNIGDFFKSSAKKVK